MDISLVVIQKIHMVVLMHQLPLQLNHVPRLLQLLVGDSCEKHLLMTGKRMQQEQDSNSQKDSSWQLVIQLEHILDLQEMVQMEQLQRQVL